MTITAAGLAGSTGYGPATSGTRVIGSLTAGQLLVVPVGRFSPTSQAFASGDLTKTAGTATLGPISLDAVFEFFNSSSANVAVYSALVTGSGTCTLTLAGQPSNSFFDIGSEAFSGSWDSSRLEASSTNGAASSAAVSSGNATSASGALFVGVFDDVVGAASYTRDAAFTQLHLDTGAPNNSGSEYRIVTTGTTDAAEWTANVPIDYAAAVVVYKEVPAAGSSELVPDDSDVVTTFFMNDWGDDDDMDLYDAASGLIPKIVPPPPPPSYQLTSDLYF